MVKEKILVWREGSAIGSPMSSSSKAAPELSIGTMVPKCSVFIATSLDGFISRIDGHIDWLDDANSRVPAGEDCGYGRFMATVDALVMGRHTFELARSFGEWPYGTTPVVVLSSRT